MPITHLSTPPTRKSATNPDTFITQADTFLSELPTFATEANALAVDVNASASSASASASSASASASSASASANSASISANSASASASSAMSAPGTSATSDSGAYIQEGEQAFSIQTGKAFSVGQSVVIAYSLDPTNFAMFGNISNYDSGTGWLTVNVSSVVGSGTYYSWVVSLSASPTAPFGPLGINDLTDAKSDNNSVYLGNNAGGSVPADRRNTVIGSMALTTSAGSDNTVTGYRAMESSTAGSFNTISGANAGMSATGGYNTISGADAGMLSTGNFNTVTGYQAMGDSTAGSFNTISGANAGMLAIGNFNTIYGANAGMLVTGHFNTVTGYQAMGDSTTGSYNTIYGVHAGMLVTGTENTLLGYYAGDNITTGSKNIIIGSDVNAPSATANGQINIGNAIFGTGCTGTGTTIPSDAEVGIGTSVPIGSRLHVKSGNLTPALRAESIAGAAYIAIFDHAGANQSAIDITGALVDISDAKIKSNIVDATPKLEDVLRLMVRNFNTESSPDLKQIGFIAQEVQDIFPGLVTEIPKYGMIPDPGWEPLPERIESRQVTETVIEETEEKEIVLTQGVYVQKTFTKKTEKEAPVFDEVVLYDENRNIILGANGEALKHKVPRMEDVTLPAQTEEDRPLVRAQVEATLAIKQSVFVPILVKALQELHALVKV